MRRGARRVGEELAAGGDAFVHHDRVFGDEGAEHRGDGLWRGRAVGDRRAAGLRDALRRRRARVQRGGEVGEGGGDVVAPDAEIEEFGSVLRQDAGLVGVGEEGDRLRGARQHDAAVGFQGLDRQLNDIGNAVDGDAAGAALQHRIGPFRQQAAAGLRRDPSRRLQRLRRLGVMPEEEERVGPGQRLRRRLDICRRHPARRGGRGAVGGDAALVPRRIARQDQRRDIRAGAGGRRYRLRRVSAHFGGAGRGFHPVGDRPRDPLDIGGQRGVEGDMGDGVLAHDIDDAGPGLLGVVQVGKAVGEAGAEMEEGRGGLARNTEIPVRRARGDGLMQREDGAHGGRLVQRGDEMHLRRAGIGETDVHA